MEIVAFMADQVASLAAARADLAADLIGGRVRGRFLGSAAQ